MHANNSMNHFEFSDLNNVVLKGTGSAAAPRSKRNVPYVAPHNLPDGMFGSLPRARRGALDLPDGTFGALILPEIGTLAFSTPVVLGSLAAFMAVTGLAKSELDIYLKGFQRGLTRKQVATRNAALGAGIGAIAMGVMGYAFIKS